MRRTFDKDGVPAPPEGPASRRLTRRGFLTGLLRRRREETGPAEPPPVDPRLEELWSLLGRHREAIAFGAPASELPAPKEVLDRALLDAMAGSPAAEFAKAAGEMYAALPWFVADEELAALRLGKEAIQALDSSETGRAAVLRAYALRDRILSEVRTRGDQLEELRRDRR